MDFPLPVLCAPYSPGVSDLKRVLAQLLVLQLAHLTISVIVLLYSS